MSQDDRRRLRPPPPPVHPSSSYHSSYYPEQAQPPPPPPSSQQHDARYPYQRGGHAHESHRPRGERYNNNEHYRRTSRSPESMYPNRNQEHYQRYPAYDSDMARNQSREYYGNSNSNFARNSDPRFAPEHSRASNYVERESYRDQHSHYNSRNYASDDRKDHHNHSAIGRNMIDEAPQFERRESYGKSVYKEEPSTQRLDPRLANQSQYSRSPSVRSSMDDSRSLTVSPNPNRSYRSNSPKPVNELHTRRVSRFDVQDRKPSELAKLNQSLSSESSPGHVDEQMEVAFEYSSAENKQLSANEHPKSDHIDVKIQDVVIEEAKDSSPVSSADGLSRLKMPSEDSFRSEDSIANIESIAETSDVVDTEKSNQNKDYFEQNLTAENDLSNSSTDSPKISSSRTSVLGSSSNRGRRLGFGQGLMRRKSVESEQKSETSPVKNSEDQRSDVALEQTLTPTKSAEIVKDEAGDVEMKLDSSTDKVQEEVIPHNVSEDNSCVDENKAPPIKSKFEVLAEIETLDNDISKQEYFLQQAKEKLSHLKDYKRRNSLQESDDFADEALHTFADLNPRYLFDELDRLVSKIYIENGRKASVAKKSMLHSKLLNSHPFRSCVPPISNEKKNLFFRVIRRRKIGIYDEQTLLADKWWNIQSAWEHEMDSKRIHREDFPNPSDTAFLRAINNTARLPMQLSEDDYRRKRVFNNQNGLIEDMKEEERRRKSMTVWTDEEKEIFKKRYSKHPKNFKKILSYLPNKSLGDCITYYYVSKHSENYKKLANEYQFTKKANKLAPFHQTGISSPVGPRQNASKPNKEKVEKSERAEKLEKNEKVVRPPKPRKPVVKPSNGSRADVKTSTVDNERDTAMDVEEVSSSTDPNAKVISNRPGRTKTQKDSNPKPLKDIKPSPDAKKSSKKEQGMSVDKKNDISKSSPSKTLSNSSYPQTGAGNESVPQGFDASGNSFYPLNMAPYSYMQIPGYPPVAFNGMNPYSMYYNPQISASSAPSQVSNSTNEKRENASENQGVSDNASLTNYPYYPYGYPAQFMYGNPAAAAAFYQMQSQQNPVDYSNYAALSQAHYLQMQQLQFSQMMNPYMFSGQDPSAHAVQDPSTQKNVETSVIPESSSDNQTSYDQSIEPAQTETVAADNSKALES